MSVKQRLTMLVAAMAFGLLVVAGIGVYQIARVYAAANFANDNTVPALTALNELIVGIERERIRTMRHVFVAESAAEIADIDRSIAGAEQDIQAAFDAYEPTIVDAEDRRRFEEVLSHFRRFEVAQAPVLDASRSNEKGLARERFLSFDEAGKALETEIHDFIEYNIGLGQKGAADARDIRDRQLFVMTAVAGLTLLAAILIGAWMIRHLMGQLGGEPAYAAEIANKMAAGELVDFQIRPGDKESVLAAMHRILSTLKEFVSAQQENARQHDLGMIDHQIPVERFHGVYAQMAHSINELVKAHIAVKMRVVEVVSRYAVGDLSVDMDRLPGRKAEITKAIDGVKASLEAVNGQIKELVEAAVAGDFKARGDAERFQHEFREMVEGLNRLMDISDVGLGEVSRILEALAKGDLTQRIEGDYQGTFGRLQKDSNGTVARLREVVGQIMDSTEEIDRAAKEIAAGNQDLSSRTESQASSLEETASAMEELSSTVKQNAENARLANDLAQSSNASVARGGDLVRRVVSTMTEIQDSSRRIADIITVIDGIAFQTNILALNAAVEAARAGEQGRGFAVVAGEVRSLAQRSATAAKEIKDLIAESVNRIDEGATLVNEAGTAIEEVVTSSTQVATLVTEISSASREQSTGIEQVAQAIGQMDEMTQQNAALVEQAAAAAESLEEQTNGLVRSMNLFQLGAGSDTQALVASTSKPVARPAPKPVSRPVKQVPAPVRPKTAQAAGAEDEWDEF
ncbi:methyl-accepting chemotaxis protein [Imhoffiella purpurea]|nr:methyl-accepting chemotaxis protein [Imhoffiella purpurea]